MAMFIDRCDVCGTHWLVTEPLHPTAPPREAAALATAALATAAAAARVETPVPERFAKELLAQAPPTSTASKPF